MSKTNRMLLVINVVGTMFIWGIYCIEATLFAFFNIIVPSTITGTWMTYKWLFLSQQPMAVSATAILTALISITLGYLIMRMVVSWIRRGS
jgi:uncharacterized membrane protein